MILPVRPYLDVAQAQAMTHVAKFKLNLDLSTAVLLEATLKYILVQVTLFEVLLFMCAC